MAEQAPSMWRDSVEVFSTLLNLAMRSDLMMKLAVEAGLLDDLITVFDKR